MSNVVMIGGGGHAKVLISILSKITAFRIIGYTSPENRGEILGVGYLGNDSILPELARKPRGCGAIIGVGSTRVSDKRTQLKLWLESLGFDLPAVISPDAVVNQMVTIGKATVVMDGVVINSGTTIGDCAIINSNSTVEHDCVIGDDVHIAPGATLSGGVKVGNHSLIGVGATIIQNIKIAEDCLIGAGAAVVRDCESAGVYLGTPARKVK